MKSTQQNPKLAHLEKLIETLEGKIRFKLEEQVRLAHNPERALDEADKLIASMTGAFKEAFSRTGDVYFDGDDVPVNPTGWVMSTVVSRRNMARCVGPVSCVFSYVKEGVVQFAAIWQPANRHFAHAGRGLGAVITHEGRLRMSAAQKLGVESVITLPWNSTDAAAVLAKANAENMHTRKSGCAAQDILTTASGRADVMVATQLTPAVAYAAQLFVSEAGGKLSEVNGTYIASNLAVHASAVKIFS